MARRFPKPRRKRSVLGAELKWRLDRAGHSMVAPIPAPKRIGAGPARRLRIGGPVQIEGRTYIIQARQWAADRYLVEQGWEGELLVRKEGDPNLYEVPFRVKGRTINFGAKYNLGPRHVPRIGMEPPKPLLESGV